MEAIHREPGHAHLTLQASVVFEVSEMVPIHWQFVSVAITPGTPYPSSDPTLLPQG